MQTISVFMYFVLILLYLRKPKAVNHLVPDAVCRERSKLNATGFGGCPIGALPLHLSIFPPEGGGVGGGDIVGIRQQNNPLSRELDRGGKIDTFYRSKINYIRNLMAQSKGFWTQRFCQ